MAIKNLELFFRHYFWVILLSIGCFALYEQAVAQKNREKLLLEEQLSSLHVKKKQLLENQKQLQTQVENQNNPEWIELVLMRELGVVPEGQTKVYFPNG